MPTLMPDKCPRCGNEVSETGPDEWTCAGMSCTGFWASGRGWERECIARDVAGTKAKMSPSEYLEGRGSSSLRGELGELVALAAISSLGTVRDAVVTSIAGRKHQMQVDRPARGSGEEWELLGQIKVLEGMQNWIEQMMREYGENDDDED